MPTITIIIPDPDQAIDVWASYAHEYGIDAVTINSNGSEPDTHVDVDTDPTPPHGIARPTVQTAVDVDCPHPGCPGRPGLWCGPPGGSNTYGSTFIHQARWNAIP